MTTTSSQEVSTGETAWYRHRQRYIRTQTDVNTDTERGMYKQDTDRGIYKQETDTGRCTYRHRHKRKYIQSQTVVHTVTDIGIYRHRQMYIQTQRDVQTQLRIFLIPSFTT